MKAKLSKVSKKLALGSPKTVEKRRSLSEDDAERNEHIPMNIDGADINDGNKAMESSLEQENENGRRCAKCCQCNSVDKKICCDIARYVIIFILVAAYFGYKLTQYFDTSVNRNEYTIDKTVSEMPCPYFYAEYPFDWYHTYIVFENTGSDKGEWSYVVGLYVWLDINATYGVSNDFIFDDYIVMQDFSNNKSDTGGFATDIDNFDIGWVLNRTTTDGLLMVRLLGTGYKPTTLQFIYIPSDECVLAINETSGFVLYDLRDDANFAQSTIDFNANHKNILKFFTKISSLFWKYRQESYEMGVQYFINFAYAWFEKTNTVDNDAGVDQNFEYFSNYLVGVRDLSKESSIYSSYGFAAEIGPDEGGIKTSFMIEPLFDVLEVLSLSGGMFATVNSIITLLAILAIWGFDFSRCISCCKYQGFAHHAEPSQLETRKFKRWVEAKIEEKHEDKIAELEGRIKRLERECDQSSS